MLDSRNNPIVSPGAKKNFQAPGTARKADHYPFVTAETPLPSKRLVIRSRKASARSRVEAFFVDGHPDARSIGAVGLRHHKAAQSNGNYPSFRSYIAYSRLIWLWIVSAMATIP